MSVVLADANVLYSRVLRDYLLYGMTEGLVRIRWSREILREVVEHLAANLDTFDESSGARLVAAMNLAFPHSQIDLTPEAVAAVRHLTLPDPNDRHVIAAAVAAEVDLICTDDRTGFPPKVMADFGIDITTPDSLLSALIEQAPVAMLNAHRMAVSRLPGHPTTRRSRHSSVPAPYAPLISWNRSSDARHPRRACLLADRAGTSHSDGVGQGGADSAELAHRLSGSRCSANKRAEYGCTVQPITEPASGTP